MYVQPPSGDVLLAWCCWWPMWERTDAREALRSADRSRAHQEAAGGESEARSGSGL